MAYRFCLLYFLFVRFFVCCRAVAVSLGSWQGGPIRSDQARIPGRPFTRPASSSAAAVTKKSTDPSLGSTMANQLAGMQVRLWFGLLWIPLSEGRVPLSFCLLAPLEKIGVVLGGTQWWTLLCYKIRYLRTRSGWPVLASPIDMPLSL